MDYDLGSAVFFEIPWGDLDYWPKDYFLYLLDRNKTNYN